MVETPTPIDPAKLAAAKKTLGFETGKFRIDPKISSWEVVREAMEVIDLVPEKSLDLTSREGVATFMIQSHDEPDWKRRTDEIQKANGGSYPTFWFGVITGEQWSNSGNDIMTITGKRWKENEQKKKT